MDETFDLTLQPLFVSCLRPMIHCAVSPLLHTIAMSAAHSPKYLRAAADEAQQSRINIQVHFVVSRSSCTFGLENLQ
jgi:hypothetical protein